MTGQTRLALFGALAVGLGAMSLLPVIAGQAWFGLTLLGLVLVTGTGEVCRRLRLPRLAVPLVQFGVLALFFTARFAGDVAVLRVFPGPGALEALGRVLNAGFEDISKYAPPVPPTDGITLLAAGGICLVALVVDVLAVTLRRAALAGLPLLALYSVSAAVVKDGVPWLVFALAGFGYLWLLLAEGRDRVSQWGRPLRTAADGRTPDRGGPHDVETAPLAQLGRRIGMTALGLAIVVPAIVPDVSASLLPGGSGGFGGGGGPQIQTVSPMATLKRDLRLPTNVALLTVRTNNPNPAGQYLKDSTLDEFNGREWRASKNNLSDVPDSLPAPEGLSPDVQRQLWETEITVSERFKSAWLPVPRPATDVEVDGRWRFDPKAGDIIADRRQDTAGIRYRVKSMELEPTTAQLNTAARPEPPSRDDLALPRDLPPVVLDTAKRVTADARTPYEQAVKLQAWFQTAFTYDTEVKSGHDKSLLEQFLSDRRGYCEQFAATMAVMARQLNIPARVAVGFTAGERGADGTWTVKSHDRHAWPELYLNGLGWLRFEPTPGIDGQNGNGNQPQWTLGPSGGTGPNAPNEVPDATASPSPGSDTCTGPRQNRFECEQQARDEQLSPEPFGAGGGGSFPYLPVGGAVLALLVLALPWFLRTTNRRRRLAGADPVAVIEGAWAELRDTVRDYGFTWDPAETPRQLAARLRREAVLDDAAAEGLTRIARAAERLRFARTPGPVGDLFADVALVRGGLALVVTRAQRWRAVLLPPSSASLLSLPGEVLGRTLDRVDDWGLRMRRAVRARRQGTTAP